MSAIFVVAGFCLSAGPVAAQALGTVTTGALTITPNGATFTDNIGPGGLPLGEGAQIFNWQINNASGTANPSPDVNNQVSGWGQLRATRLTIFPGQMTTANLTWSVASTSGQQFELNLQTLVNPTTVGSEILGPMANFDPSQSYFWPLITYQGTYAGPTDSATLTADTLFNTSLFANAIPPASRFSIALDQVNKQVDLVYSVPEPGTLGLVTLGLLGLWGRCRHRDR
jgi:hypothetical protein